MLGPATTCTIDTTLSQPFDRYGTHTKNYKTVSIADSKYINTCRPSLCCVFLSLFLIRCSSLLLSMFAFKFAFVRSCIRSFVHSLVRSFARSFIRSFVVRSFVCLLVRCILCTWGDQPASRFLQKAFLPFLTGGAGD